MPLKENRLYPFAVLAVVTGYAWVIINLTINKNSDLSAPGLCLFKTVTGIPCPSCGSTRSVLSIVDGDFGQALIHNPIGFILALMLVILPPWLIFDLITGKRSMHNFYNRAEFYLKKKAIIVPLIMIILIIWIRNILISI
ncbi:MAG: DUF2752 domain-containing protein [Bacteroidales bacterium]|nr:DUF2752 domain-containing protein [Bacteroidales bacterium]